MSFFQRHQLAFQPWEINATFPVLLQTVVDMLVKFFILISEPSIGKSAKKIVQENVCLDNGNAKTNVLINQRLAKTAANHVNI